MLASTMQFSNTNQTTHTTETTYPNPPLHRGLVDAV